LDASHAGLVNHLQNRVDFFVNLRVPESQNQPAILIEVEIPSDVASVLPEVTFTIQFDDNSGFHTREIEVERSKRVLPTEFEFGQFTAAKLLPQDLFCGCHFSAEFSRSIALLRV